MGRKKDLVGTLVGGRFARPVVQVQFAALSAVLAAGTAMGYSTPRLVRRIVWSVGRRILSGELHPP